MGVYLTKADLLAILCGVKFKNFSTNVPIWKSTSKLHFIIVFTWVIGTFPPVVVTIPVNNRNELSLLISHFYVDDSTLMKTRNQYL